MRILIFRFLNRNILSWIIITTGNEWLRHTHTHNWKKNSTDGHLAVINHENSFLRKKSSRPRADLI